MCRESVCYERKYRRSDRRGALTIMGGPRSRRTGADFKSRQAAAIKSRRREGDPNGYDPLILPLGPDSVRRLTSTTQQGLQSLQALRLAEYDQLIPFPQDDLRARIEFQVARDALHGHHHQPSIFFQAAFTGSATIKP